MNIINDPHRVYSSVEAAAILLGIDIVKGLTTDEQNELIKYQFYLSQAVESGDLSYYDKSLLKEIPIANTDIIERMFSYKFTGQNLIDFAKKKNIQLKTSNITKNNLVNENIIDEKLLSTRTENNYLRLILALANGIKGFNPKKPYEAAQLIIDETGIDLSKQAISDYISKAYELESKKRD